MPLSSEKISRLEVVEEIYPKLLSSVDQIVKHAGYIDPVDKENWIRKAIERNPYFFKFDAYTNPEYSRYIPPENIGKAITDHITGFLLPRLNGVGGSEIGRVISHITGVASAFGGNMQTVAKEKLMKIPPQYVTSHMMRGIDNESYVRDLSIENGYTPRPDLVKQYQDNLLDENGNYRHPFLRANLDDISQKLVNGVVRTVIPDYKAPHKVDTTLPLDYIAQLHQYAILALVGNEGAKNPVNIDSMVSIQLDYQRRSIVDKVVPMDASIVSAILEGGAELWQSVSHGLVPELPPETLVYDMSAEARKDEVLSGLLQDADRLRVMQGVVADRQDHTDEQVKHLIQKRFGGAEGSLEIGSIALKSSLQPVLDEETMPQIAEKFGLSLEGLTDAKAKKAIKDAAAKEGVDLADELPVESVITIRKSTKNPAKEYRASMEQVYGDLLSPVLGLDVNKFENFSDVKAKIAAAVPKPKTRIESDLEMMTLEMDTIDREDKGFVDRPALKSVEPRQEKSDKVVERTKEFTNQEDSINMNKNENNLTSPPKSKIKSFSI